MYTAAGRVNYVLQDSTSSISPCHNNTSECYSLTDVFNMMALSNSRISNVTIILHPGIHTIYSNDNKVVLFRNATNFEIKAANLTEGATINCNGSVGFAFDSCTNLKLSGIEFKECGAHLNANQILLISHQNVSIDFVLFIFHSFNVHISSGTVLNGNGIGLIVINAYGTFKLSESRFINNKGNLYFFIADNVSTIPRDSDITIKILNS